MTCVTRLKTFVAYQQGVRELIDEIQTTGGGWGGGGEGRTHQHFWFEVCGSTLQTKGLNPFKSVPISAKSIPVFRVSDQGCIPLRVFDCTHLIFRPI